MSLEKTHDFEGLTPEELLGPLNEVEKKNAPKSLFIAGDGSVLQSGPRVSIVGSRKATPRGTRLVPTNFQRALSRAALSS